MSLIGTTYILKIIINSFDFFFQCKKCLKLFGQVLLKKAPLGKTHREFPQIPVGQSVPALISSWSTLKSTSEKDFLGNALKQPIFIAKFGKKSLFGAVHLVYLNRNGSDAEKAHPANLPDLCTKFQVASSIRVTWTGEQFIENVEKMFFFESLMGWVGQRRTWEFAAWGRKMRAASPPIFCPLKCLTPLLFILTKLLIKYFA